MRFTFNTEQQRPWLTDGTADWIWAAAERAGIPMMFWGTDWTRLPCSWRQGVTLFTEELSWLSLDDKDWIMGRGLCEWLGWPTPRAI